MHADQVSKLLIVDDLQENLRALNAVIRQDDRIIYQANSGEAALSLLLEHEFALAIIDVQMPDMDGFQLAELMRGTERTRNIPIVFVSAAGKELNYAFKGYETGAVDFLHKPLDVNAVKSKVNVFVALHQQRNETRRQLAALKKSRHEQDLLMAELRATQTQLQHSLQLRDDFMSIVAHELRTPLNTLLLEAQVRQMALDRGNMALFGPEQFQKMIGRDTRQIKSMVRLIEDMLDVSRIRSGKLSIRTEDTELVGLLKRVISDLEVQASAVGSIISLNAPDEIAGVWDAFRIEQIIVNLLTNALRYGSGKPVEVQVLKQQDQVSIQVRDHGIGISKENQTRIFYPFERAVDENTSGGLGLGLYISKQLVEAHQGSIAVDSRQGEGSAFRITLPLTTTASIAR